MGAGRTEVARALVGADPITAGTITLRGRPVRIGSPAEAARHRIGYLSEDRKQLGLLLEQDVTANVVLSSLAERFQRFGFVRSPRDAGHRAGAGRRAADQDAVGRPDRAEPLRRQPAEGRAGQVAGQGLRRAHRRRAHPRHRRGRQGGDLRAAQQPRRAGQVDHHDLLGAARGAAHVAPHRGDERGPDHRRAGRRGGHPGARHAPGDAAPGHQPRGRGRARPGRADPARSQEQETDDIADRHPAAGQPSRPGRTRPGARCASGCSSCSRSPA